MDTRSVARLLGALGLLAAGFPASTLAALPAEVPPAPTVPGIQAGPRAAAERGLRDLLERYGRTAAESALPPGCPFRVPDLAALRSATVGPGFEVHLLSPERVRAGGPLGGMAVASGLWYFPVSVDGSARGLVEVGRVDGTWRLLSAGGAGLAAAVERGARLHAGNGAFRFLRSLEAAMDLLEVGSGFLPLTGAGDRLGSPGPLKGDDPALRSALAPQP